MTTTPRRPRKARSRIQRAFLRWLHDNHSRFLTAPPQLVKHTDHHLMLTIPGLNPAVSLTLTWELGFHVTWDGQSWDSLIFFEAYPLLTADGYICHLCQPEGRKTYPNREALWIDHEFEDCLNWVNSELINSRWLALYEGEHQGLNVWMTWARLIDEPDLEAKVNLPVWVRKLQ